jgi:hypothetical protein
MPLSVLSLVALSSVSFAANPLGPGISVREVAAPPELVSGISSISVGKISGAHGSLIADELVAGLQNDDREIGPGTAADIAGNVVQMGAMVGGQMLASKLGGIGSKATSTLTETAGAVVAGKITGDKLTLEDGLTVAPFPYKKSGGDGTISGSVAVEPSESRYEKKEPLKDDSGNVIKDSDGQTVMTTVQCLKRSATTTLTWSLDKGGKALLSGEESQTMSDDKCGKEIGDVLSIDDLASSAARGMGSGIVARIKPAWHSHRIGLRGGKALAAPIRAVRQGDHEGAMCLLHHLVEFDAENGAAHANLGAVHEALGHHDAALTAYATALEKGGPKRLAEKGAERTTARQAEVKGMVDAYGLTWAIEAPDFAACPTLPEGEPRLAKRKLSVEAGGETIEVEKGELLFLQSTEGKTSKVKTMEGTELELPAKALK